MFRLDDCDEQGESPAAPAATPRGARNSSLTRGYQTLGATFYSMASDTEDCGVAPPMARTTRTKPSKSGSVTHRVPDEKLKATTFEGEIPQTPAWLHKWDGSFSGSADKTPRTPRDQPRSGSVGKLVARFERTAAPTAFELDLGIAPVAALPESQVAPSPRVMKSSGVLSSLVVPPKSRFGASRTLHIGSTQTPRSMSTPRGMRSAIC